MTLSGGGPCEPPISVVADTLVSRNQVGIFSVADVLTGQPHIYDVPIDSTVTRMSILVTGVTSVEVKRPDGSVVQPGDPNVTVTPFSIGAIYDVETPTVGIWRVTVNGSQRFSLQVSGDSNLLLADFQFVRQGGRRGHTGMFPISGFPLSGQAGTVDALMSGPFGSVQFELRSKAGDLLQALSMTPVPDNAHRFSGTLTVPAIPFVVYATGQDSGGASFSRMLPGAISPQGVEISRPAPQELLPGVTTTYVFTITNVGASDTFMFSAMDDRHFIQGDPTRTFSLGTNQSTSISVQLSPPGATSYGTPDRLVATVQSVGTTGASNFMIVDNQVASSPGPMPAIPTLSEWGLALLLASLMVSGVALLTVRRL